MKTVIRRVLPAVLLLAALLIASCVFPGTATMHLWNTSGKTIVHVYVRAQGEVSWGSDHLNGTIAPGDAYDFFGIPPGWQEVLIEFDDTSGLQKTIEFHEGTYHIVSAS